MNGSGGASAHTEQGASTALAAVAPLDAAPSRQAPRSSFDRPRSADMSSVVRPPDDQGQPPPGRDGRRYFVAALVVLVLLAGAFAAVLVTLGNSSTSSSEDLATEARKPKTDEEKIIENVKNYFRAHDEALVGPDPNDPLLPVYATGPALQQAVDAVRKAQQQNLATRVPPNSVTRQQVTVVSVNGERAQIRVCSVSDGYLVHADTGKPAYDYPPGFAVTGLWTGDMALESGTWKVSTITREQRWEGVAGCAVGQA
jgi:hypothetical protein